MRDAREYVEPGDLVVVSFSRHPRLEAGICKQWTDKSFQFFHIKDYENHWFGPDNPDEVEDYLDENKYRPSLHTNYIRSNITQRVICVTENFLTKSQKIYYDALKERINS